jgi:serine O-acetyltransferase
MRALLEGQVVSASDNVDVVAQVLAARLSVAKIDFGVLCALFRDVLRGDPELMNTIGADLIAVRERDPACRTYLRAAQSERVPRPPDTPYRQQALVLRPHGDS